MICTVYVKRTGDDPAAQVWYRRLRAEGYEQLTSVGIERVFRLEGISGEQAMRLEPLFCHPLVEQFSMATSLDISHGPILEVGYQRAVTDPELPSILHGASALGIHSLEWVRISHRFQFTGVDLSTAKSIVLHYLYNPQVQVLLSPGEKWKTLKPQGQSGPVKYLDLGKLDDNGLNSLSTERRLFLDTEQMRALQTISRKMGRALTDAEVEMFAQTWSDHCFHTTWKSLGLLKTLKRATQDISHPLVISVFEDNAGSMRFYDGWALTVKGETHNSPSAVSPYGGIMTKHGGVIRDTLGCGQGAWPIGGSTIMGLGDPNMEWPLVPEGALHPRLILLDAIRGTADYTNPMGIPMMFPVYKFHPGYTGKCFALGHSIGIIPEKRALKGHPEPGDLAVLIGGLTGRDGLHGATVSSSSMTSETSTVDAAHVQIGHPIEERKFMEAIPVLRDQDCLRAITDLGAAGLSSAAGEMGSGTGVWINLAWVSLKTEGLFPWEIWISESQERMLLCVPPEKWKDASRILERYEVHTAVVGKFTDTGRCQVVYDKDPQMDPLHLLPQPSLSGNVVVDLDFDDLRKGCPLPRTRLKKPGRKPVQPALPVLSSREDWIKSISKVLSHLNICDQSSAGTQFDSTIQGITACGPYGGKNHRMPNDVWIATPLRGHVRAAAASLAFNPLYGDIDPGRMAKCMILEAVSRLVACGVSPAEIVLCDNFYTPRITPETAFHLKNMVEVCSSVSKQLGTPFISGKDSSSGTFVGTNGKRIDIPPTLAVLALGRAPDVRRLIQKPWKEPGNRLMLIGPVSSAMGGSIFLSAHGNSGGEIPDPQVEQVKKMWEKLAPFQQNGDIRSASAIGEGGLVRRLFEMSLGSGLGCRVDLASLKARVKGGHAEIALFGEMIGAILTEVKVSAYDSILKTLEGTGLGEITDTGDLSIDTGETSLSLSTEQLLELWEKPFQEVVR